MAKRKIMVSSLQASQPELTITLVLGVVGVILCFVGWLFIKDEADRGMFYFFGGAAVFFACILGMFMPIAEKKVEIEVDDNEEVATAEH